MTGKDGENVVGKAEGAGGVPEGALRMDDVLREFDERVKLVGQREAEAELALALARANQRVEALGNIIARQSEALASPPPAPPERRVKCVTARCSNCGSYCDDIEWEYEEWPEQADIRVAAGEALASAPPSPSEAYRDSDPPELWACPHDQHPCRVLHLIAHPDCRACADGECPTHLGTPSHLGASAPHSPPPETQSVGVGVTYSQTVVLAPPGSGEPYRVAPSGEDSGLDMEALWQRLLKPLLEPDAPEDTADRAIAFMRIYAKSLRDGSPWDVPATMGRALDQAATVLENALREGAAPPSPHPGKRWEPRTPGERLSYEQGYRDARERFEGSAPPAGEAKDSRGYVLPRYIAVILRERLLRAEAERDQLRAQLLEAQGTGDA